MKKIVIFVFLNTLLLASKLEFSPYLFSQDYSPDISQKNTSLNTGMKLRYENGSQNFILNFKKEYIKYRSSKKDTQSDLSFIYNFNDKTHLNLKAGISSKHSSKNEPALSDIVGDGTTLILGGMQHFYNSFNHKITIGSDFFATYYKEGIDDLGNVDKIFVYQISPFLQYSINKTYIKLMGDYVKTPMYLRKDNGLIHLTLGFSLGRFEAELSGFNGKVKSGVFDGGDTIINTKDEYENQISAKLTYNFSKNLKASFYTSQTEIKEKIIDVKEYQLGANFSYIFNIPDISFGF